MTNCRQWRSCACVLIGRPSIPTHAIHYERVCSRKFNTKTTVSGCKLCTARNVIECTFGCLETRFSCLKRAVDIIHFYLFIYWGEPEWAPHLSNGVPCDLCIYVYLVRHSINKCPHVLIHWTASIDRPAVSARAGWKKDEKEIDYS